MPRWDSEKALRSEDAARIREAHLFGGRVADIAVVYDRSVHTIYAVLSGNLLPAIDPVRVGWNSFLSMKGSADEVAAP